MSYYIGVDVGTSSVRSALVDQHGHMLSTAIKEITIWSPRPDFYEQSSTNIWAAVLFTIKEVLKTTGVPKQCVRGIGFDATCSLVALDMDGQPVSVCPSGNADCNIIMWMDHRAEIEANRINLTGDDVLKNVGGKMSLEMQPPKLLWLKENLFDTCWQRAAHFFDLPDFLTWRATGSFSRSLCSLVCKWTFLADEQGNKNWSQKFWSSIGLKDLLNNYSSRIGSIVHPPGDPCGEGLSKEAAEEMGLVAGTPVGASMIDAYAGALGCLGCLPDDPNFTLPDITSRLAIICGTSSCHMIISKAAVFVPGVWGPYYSTMLPGYWGNEGGQSATGKLIDCVIESHPAYGEVVEKAREKNMHVQSFLNSLLEDLARKNGLDSICSLTKDIHVWPDFHGNRSPIADSSLKGMICGLTLTTDANDLALRYLATIQALAYGTRHIMDEMVKSGHQIGVIYLCGGLRKNPVFVKTHADVTGVPLILPDEKESVLIGAAILGASASKDFSSIQDAMLRMGGKGRVFHPHSADREYHNKKYQVFHKMLIHQREYQQMMAS